ncbi:MAG: LysR family transcriptional regulator [Deltaproteobacteria bacterium]|nr:MAG: LysR family transcriptional regulator [Deltaproteobacteria bacterium]
MAIFAVVVEAGGFTAAAKRLGLAKSAVSRQVSLLEDHVGAQLLARTTRRSSLTEAGAGFYEHARRLVAEADAAFSELRGQAAKPTGVLRIAAPQHLGQGPLVQVICGFRALYPDVEIELVLDDAHIDLVAHNIDVAVRVGNLRDSTLIARKLATSEVVLCASPDLLARRGTPTHHSQLRDYDWIIYTLFQTPTRLRLVDPRGRRVTVRMTGPIRTNSGAANQALLRAGAGISLIPRFLVEDDLAAGDLVCLLTDYGVETVTTQAVFIPGRDLLPKVRLFIDLLAERLDAGRPGKQTSTPRQDS